MYLQAIDEWKVYGELYRDGSTSEFASAMKKVFVPGAGRALSPKAFKPGKRNVGLVTSLRIRSPNFARSWGTKIKLSCG